MFITIRAVLISLLLSISLTSPVLSQSYTSGVIRVKFKEKAMQQIQAGRLKEHQFGISAVDQAGVSIGVTKIKRIFREAGRFEKAHKKFGLHLWYEIEFKNQITVKEVLGIYQKLPEFEIVEPCLPYQLIEPVKITENSVIKPASLTGPTNDPLFAQQWHYQNLGQSGGTLGADISLTQAWTVQTGSPDVIVAVIDGGIDILHPDLQASLWINSDEIPGNGIDDDHNGYVDDVNGYGFGDNTGTIYPNFHGTHVGGTIAAVTNNEVGVSGIAGGNGTGNGVRLMSCAGFGNVGVGGFEDAMVYAADNGAVISQNSWGGGSSSIEAAIDYFVARAGLDNSDENFDDNIQIGPMAGGIVIFAAGNSNTSDTSVGYPASYSPVMAVASTDHNDVRSYFSNFGSWVDIAAPGSEVYSTYPVELGSYTHLSGTSMACPHVSGVAALIISQFKGVAYSPNQVWDRLQFTADDIDALNPDYINMLGSGRLNAYQALQVADEIPPDAITSLTIAEPKLNSMVLQWIASGSSGSEGAASSYDLRYSTTPITAANFNTATPVIISRRPSTAGTQEEFEVKNLLHNTTYYFAIKSRDFFGNIAGISNVVSGKTLRPPVIEVTPASIDENLFSGGTSTRYLTVRNVGASDLILKVSTTSMSAAAGGRVGNAILNTNNVRANGNTADQPKAYPVIEKNGIGSRYNTHTNIRPMAGGHLFSLDLTTGSIIEVDTENGTILNSFRAPESLSGGPDGLAFDGTDLYFVNSFGTRTIYRINSETGEVISTLSLSTLPYIDALAHSGKYLYAMDYSNNEIFEIDYEAGGIVRTIIPNVDIGGGLTFAGKRGSLFVSNFEFGIYEINIETSEIINSFSPRGSILGLGYSQALDVLFAANSSTGVIDVYDAENNAYLYSLSGLVTSALASDEGGNKWLDVSISSATVSAGSSVVIPVGFNAMGLNGGIYSGGIEIRSNDPITPIVDVPVTLNVTGAPNITAGVQGMNFGEVYTNLSIDTTIVIKNNGTDNLLVSSVSVSHSAFVVSTTPFSLVPGESENLNVRFTPVAVSDYAADLVLTSNDPDQGTLVIPLTGEGVLPPVVRVDPLSIDANLMSGQSEVRTITIQNTGGSALIWSLQYSEESEPLSISSSNLVSASKQEPVKTGFNNHFEQVNSELSRNTFPQAVGDFLQLSSSPVPLTCVSIDPVSGYIYAQANNGTAFYRYSPTTSQWTQLTNCPIYSGNNGGAVYLNGEIYTAYAENSSQLGVYSVASNSWRTLSNNLNQGTGNITTDGTYVYLVKGIDFKRYSPQSNVWTSLAAPPFYFEGWGGLSFYKNSIYGHQGNGYSGFAKYDLAANAWTTLQSVPGGAVLGSAMDFHNGVYYAYGSYDGSNFYAYTIESGTWSSSTIPLFYVNDGGMVYVPQRDVRGIYFVQGEKGSGFGRFETGLFSNWLAVEPTSGEVPAGESRTIQVTLDAEGLYGGTYEGEINIQHNDPVMTAIEIPVTLHVTGAADIDVSASSIAFGEVYIGAYRDSVILIRNEGTDVLSVSDISVGNTNYEIDFEPFDLEPDEQKEINVVFRPLSPGTYNTSLMIVSNDPDNATIVIPLTGIGLFNPLAVTPGSLQSSLISGQQENKNITISNNGASSLTWRATIDGAGSGYLNDILVNLNQNYSLVTSVIPNRYDFYGGESGYYIGDGGYDMYDDGNFLTTDASGSFSYIYYTNGELMDDSRFGASGKYFTAKYPGLFVLAADVAINTFTISGGLGADGSGSLDAHVLSVSRGGRNYKGFIKRVYNAGDPSVNHLIIMEDNGVATHSYELSTNSDFHQVTSLSGVKRIYYLLFAGSSGAYINNTSMQGIMNTFLDAVNEGTSWVSLNKKTGTLLPGASEQVPVTFSALNMDGGVYSASISVSDNLSSIEPVSVPVTLTVIGKPDIDLSGSSIDFQSVYVGASVERYISLRNLGSDVLVVDNIVSTDARFQVINTNFSLAPRDSMRVVIRFTPESAGAFTGNIEISSNDPDEVLRFVSVSGSGKLPPLINITPDVINNKVFQGDRKYIYLKVRNIGGDIMDWSIANSWSIPIWASLSSTSGQILIENEQTLKLELDSKNLGIGNYSFNLLFNYNAPVNSTISIPVTLQVTQNHAPIIINPIDDQTIGLHESGIQLNLASNFMDEDDEPLLYQVSVNTNVVQASVLGSQLLLVPIELGETEVSVWSVDGLGERADLHFMVTVEGVTDLENEATVANLQNYPNPFNTSTNITYHLRKNGHVQLVIQDLAGRVLETLLNESEEQGDKLLEYQGNTLESGLYFYHLIIDGKSAGIRKMIKY